MRIVWKMFEISVKMVKLDQKKYFIRKKMKITKIKGFFIYLLYFSWFDKISKKTSHFFLLFFECRKVGKLISVVSSKITSIGASSSGNNYCTFFLTKKFVISFDFALMSHLSFRDCILSNILVKERDISQTKVDIKWIFLATGTGPLDHQLVCLILFQRWSNFNEPYFSFFSWKKKSKYFS